MLLSTRRIDIINAKYVKSKEAALTGNGIFRL